VDRLRKVIQQQKSTQIMRQTQGGAGQPINPQTSGALTMGGTPPQMGGANPVTSQTTQQGLMMSQTNTMAMGGGQITQNVVTSSGQPGILGQNVPGGAMRPTLRMQPNMGPQASQPAPESKQHGAGNDGDTHAESPLREPVASGEATKSGKDQSAEADTGGGAATRTAVQEPAGEDKSHEDVAVARSAADLPTERDEVQDFGRE
jgi:hypothetical protein